MADDHDPDLDSAYALKTPDDNRTLYRSWAESYDAEFVEASGYRLPGLVARSYLSQGGQWPALDVGCGTGAVAAALPAGSIVDGLDLSPEMIDVADRSGRYRTLTVADLLQPLPLSSDSYAGVLSAGTFTHGHVGAAALDELVRILAPGGLAVLSIRDEIWDTMGFSAALSRLVKFGATTAPDRVEERIYRDAESAPEGHGADMAFITTFRRL